MLLIFLAFVMFSLLESQLEKEFSSSSSPHLPYFIFLPQFSLVFSLFIICAINYGISSICRFFLLCFPRFVHLCLVLPSFLPIFLLSSTSSGMLLPRITPCFCRSDSDTAALVNGYRHYNQ